ncbi:MAG: hypothetical protein ACE141_14190 [Bryobacteraceae bacterium]
MRAIVALNLALLCWHPALLAQRRVPADLSAVRGSNYRAIFAKDTLDHWLNYNPADTERDLNYAKRLNLNQVRVFIAYEAWLKDKPLFRKNLQQLARACRERGIGLMPVVWGYTEEMIFQDSARPLAREFAVDLVAAIGKEPALAFWDVSNEPDWPPTPPDRVKRRMELARYMAGVFRELDPVTPVTVGCALMPCTEQLADAVDVLSYHDYLQTRNQIRDTIARAKALSAKTRKPIFNTELGCIGRANPYDITLQEHMDAGVGWYIWELMITRRWGDVHGVFYADGSVRDPSIAAAMLGFFRNRGSDVVLENPDREEWVTRAIANARRWIDTPQASWQEGLDAAETAAHMLEGAQLVPMREPPTRQVDRLRGGAPDPAALRALLLGYIQALEPYQNKR